MRWYFKVPLVFLGYYLLAEVGIHLTFEPTAISAIWPPNALVLAVILFHPAWTWPLWMLVTLPADLAVNLAGGNSIGMSFGFFAADWFEVLLAAALLRKFYGGRWDFGTLRQMSLFFLIAVLFAPALSGIPGALVTGMIPDQPHFAVRWLRWFLGDATTHLVLTTTLIMFFSHAVTPLSLRRDWKKTGETGILVVILLLTLIVTVHDTGVLQVENFSGIAFLSFPILLWAATRYSIRFTSFICTFLAFSTIWIASRGFGPFSSHPQAQNVLDLQFFILLVLSPVMYLSVSLQEQRNTSENLAHSDRQKGILLKEVHHRVKNNLLVITGLMDLQAKRLSSEDDRETCKENRNRVLAMALIHENLYQTPDLSSVEFVQYIRTIFKSLANALRIDPARVGIRIEGPEETLVIDTAIPVGLIVNELASNALKHAFPGGRKGLIRVDFRTKGNGEYLLTVSDNGVGFPQNLDPMSVETLGMKLVTLLVDQLGGRMELDRSGGTTFRISFHEYREAGTVLY